MPSRSSHGESLFAKSCESLFAKSRGPSEKYEISGGNFFSKLFFRPQKNLKTDVSIRKQEAEKAKPFPRTREKSGQASAPSARVGAEARPVRAIFLHISETGAAVVLDLTLWVKSAKKRPNSSPSAFLRGKTTFLRSPRLSVFSSFTAAGAPGFKNRRFL